MRYPLCVMATTCLVLGVLLAGCGGPALPEVRFVNAPPVRAVDDRRDVARAPDERKLALNLYHLDGTVYRRITRGLELPRQRRALGVNAHDEVPDSTWFTNRIGVRDVSLDELRAAPGGIGSPEAHMPWTIVSTKVGGRTIGFIIKDARGERYLLKFDRAGKPELETAADVIAGKLLWGLGYNVPEDHVVYFRRGDLVLASDAVDKDVFGNEHALKSAELERRLATIEVDKDGRIRGLASRLLDGEPLGGHPGEGVRKDDPNDRIRHELRRDLRGAYAIFAWLDHGDIKEDNFLDMWVTDPANPSVHYVVHYLIDFGLSLGVNAYNSRDRSRGREYKVDFAQMIKVLLTFGVWRRPWEGRTDPGLRGVGVFETETFAPGRWRPMTPAYVPFRTADRFDAFWGSKLLMRFTREQIHAVVETGRLTDPRAVEYLTDTLVARQRLTARHWFREVNPLDRFEVAGDTLCFDDLTLLYGLEDAVATTRYELTSHDRAGRPVGARRQVAATGAHTCAPLTMAPGGDGYSIVRVDTRRPGFARGTLVHVARDTAGAARVIGVWRL
jgi:hypothetical protein